MNRRDLITLLSGAAAWPLAARAQTANVQKVGFLYPGPLAAAKTRIPPFLEGLRLAGFRVPGEVEDPITNRRWRPGAPLVTGGGVDRSKGRCHRGNQHRGGAGRASRHGRYSHRRARSGDGPRRNRLGCQPSAARRQHYGLLFRFPRVPDEVAAAPAGGCPAALQRGGVVGPEHRPLPTQSNQGGGRASEAQLADPGGTQPCRP